MDTMLSLGNGRVALRSAGLVWLGIAACLTAASARGDEPGKAQEPNPPTFTRDVTPILQAKCQNCHRRNQAGHLPLETYDQARKRAWDIVSMVEDRSMPPWKPAPGVGPELKHDLSLTAEEIATLAAWAEAEAPLGDPKDMPPPREFAEGWTLGVPDLVLEPTEDFVIPAASPDMYRCFVLPTNLARDSYVAAIDFRPSNPRVVHHITAFIDASGAARQRDKAEPGPGYTSFSGPGIPYFEMMGFWAAGHAPNKLPDGIGIRLPRQSDIIIQIHYHATGKPEVDRTQIGLYLSREPVKQALHWNAAQDFELRLPAGEAEIEVKASWFVPVDLEVLAVSPHMHQLGRDIRMSVTYPDGRTIDLISIPDWDPSWQSMYHFQDRIPLPVNSVVNVVAHYDNSARVRNPNQPPKLVTWGHDVEDEMCDGFIAVVKKGQDLTHPRATDDLGRIFSLQRLRNMRREISNRSR